MEELQTEGERDSVIGDPVTGAAPLRVIVAQIEDGFSAGDYARTAALLNNDPLSAWFGLSTERFGEIIATLVREHSDLSMFVRAMDSIFSMSEDERTGPLDNAAAGAINLAELGEENVVAVVGQSFMMRVQGRPVEALRLSRLAGEQGVLQPLFEGDDGLGLFSALQHGVTAMLAGDFTEALTSLTRARLHVMTPSLAFLSRDACVKKAMMHAAYGDSERAIMLLEEADQIPRTESWAEELIDAGAAIATTMLPTENPEQALQRLNEIPLRAVGEMWPYYVLAVHRVLLAAGDQGGAQQRLAMFEAFPLPRVEGEGFSGSVLLVTGAMSAMLRGDLAEAREQLERADGSIAITRIIQAVLELVAGRPREALSVTAGLHEQTRGLRKLEIWRLAIIANAHLMMGARDDCAGVLEFALGLPGGVRQEELPHFTAAVREFARSRFEEWPREENEIPDWFPTTAEALSDRELDVLHDLAGGRSREEIARSQFISLNTLKAHLRSIYRKLEVNSRAAAVLEAERRGVL